MVRTCIGCPRQLVNDDFVTVTQMPALLRDAGVPKPPPRRRNSVGLVPVTRRNSRLKFDLLMKPESNITRVTGSSVLTSRSHAERMRNSLTYCETLTPWMRLTAIETRRAGRLIFRAMRLRLSSGSR